MSKATPINQLTNSLPSGGDETMQMPIVQDILNESLEHEVHALNLYKKLLACVEDASVYLEEYTRGMIGQEEQHSLELKKMLKDFSN